tara:strand:- start:1 stop:540 length:540 start_codon:yes stop_codon:yes gene_type:complete
MVTQNDTDCKKIPKIEFDEYNNSIQSNVTYNNCNELKDSIKEKLLSSNIPTTPENVKVIVKMKNNPESIKTQLDILKNSSNVELKKITKEEITKTINLSRYMLDPRIEHYVVIDSNFEKQVIDFCSSNPGALLSETLGMFCPKEQKNKKINLGLIIGAGVGGVVFIGLLIFLIIYLRRR